MKLKIIEEKEILKSLHQKLIDLIIKYGEHFRKKHGEWLKLKLENNKFLQLDTWSKAILLKEGTGEYEYWTGFKGKLLIYFGVNFGGFETHASENQFEQTIKEIELLYGVL